MLDFAFDNQVCHGPNRFLDRHGGVDAVLVVKVQAINAEPLQGSFDRRFRIGPGSVHAHNIATVKFEPEFAGDDEAVAFALYGFAHQFFIGKGAIDLGGIEKGDAKVDGAVDGLDGFIGIGVFTISDIAALDHRHAADTDGADF